MPSKTFAVPSVPPMNLFKHNIAKNIKNFGMQSIGQAPLVAEPPRKLSNSENNSIVALMQRQFLNILVPFSKSISSLHPAWHDET